MSIKLCIFLVLLIHSVQINGNCPDDELPQPSSTTTQLQYATTTTTTTAQQDLTTTATTTTTITTTAPTATDDTQNHRDLLGGDNSPASLRTAVTKVNQQIQSTASSDGNYQSTRPATTTHSSSEGYGLQPTTKQSTQTSTPSTAVVPDTTYKVQATPTPLSRHFINNTVNSPPECECIVLEDCKAWHEYGVNYSGIFTVNPDNGEPFRVYCDMTTDGGGWTVFQRRQDGSVDFYLGWDEYKKGFGDLAGEYWLGLDKIHRLTESGNNQLRVDLGDFENNVRYAKYSSFKIGNETTKYLMNVSGYSGDAGDSMSWRHSNVKFSTKDNDNDNAESASCARACGGAWWYNACHASNLNGRYLRGNHSWYANGVEWYTWTKHYYSLRFTEMKIN